MVIIIKHKSQLLSIKLHAMFVASVFSWNPSGALCSRCNYDPAETRLKNLSQLVSQPVTDGCRRLGSLATLG